MKRDTLRKNLIFQGLGGLIARIGSLIFTIILARLLIPSDFGLYNLALTIIISLTAVIDFGLSTTAVKFIVSSKTKKLARSRFLFLFKLKFIWSLIISILVLILSKYISNFYSTPFLEIPLKVGA
ncbi:oligosaccharide flippase family protein, partial [Candidatus Woesearchaeota archaeon]|nr:oligosaccharide flippase family protein [Candidatus Woesearchaeota archaeon]